MIPRISLIANLGTLIMSVVAIIYIEWRLALVFLLLSSITIFLSQIPVKIIEHEIASLHANEILDDKRIPWML